MTLLLQRLGLNMIAIKCIKVETISLLKLQEKKIYQFTKNILMIQHNIQINAFYSTWQKVFEKVHFMHHMVSLTDKNTCPINKSL